MLTCFAGSTRPNTWTKIPPTSARNPNSPTSRKLAKRKTRKTPRLQVDQERDRFGAGRNNDAFFLFLFLFLFNSRIACSVISCFFSLFFPLAFVLLLAHFFSAFLFCFVSFVLLLSCTARRLELSTLPPWSILLLESECDWTRVRCLSCHVFFCSWEVAVGRRACCGRWRCVA